MELPKDAQVLGGTSEPLSVRGFGTSTFVSLANEQTDRLLVSLREPTIKLVSFRIYVALQGIRGTNDATILSLFINLPEGAKPSENPQNLVGSEALYGLRRASSRSAKSTGGGLASMKDSTQVIHRLVASDRLDTGRVRVSLVPAKPLAEKTEITIERLMFFSVPLA
jgi:tyrosinase